MIAALFVERSGPYFGYDFIDPWDIERDARKYAGPYPVIAHPPCERWGRYWSGGPSVKVKRKKGDDGGCFEAAYKAVMKFGGVLEHPEASHAWDAFQILRPNPHGGWTWDFFSKGWVCQVEQGHYGHPARKKTWLFAKTRRIPPELKWGKSNGIRLDEGFHSKEERIRARESGVKPRKRLTPMQNRITPHDFAWALIAIAQQDGLLKGSRD